ncbi:MAG TPA: hypothetical protein VHL85_10760 [Burkholderiales bacterium]|jgi:hypothetical protein|nr:hypothetical protein [Burkholderiales bacterium]
MQIARVLVLVTCGLAAPGASAEDNLGRVRGLYVQAAPGVLVERSMTHKGGQQWADVELVAPAAGERARVLVQVPRDLPARAGDLVAVQLAGPRNEAVPLLNVSRITEIRSSALAGLEPATR